MKPYYDELKNLLGKRFENINDDIADYNDLILYELEGLEKEKQISIRENLYFVNISLYFITPKGYDDHDIEALEILGILENYKATAIQKMETAAIIINADEYNVSKYELKFDKYKLEK